MAAAEKEYRFYGVDPDQLVNQGRDPQAVVYPRHWRFQARMRSIGQADRWMRAFCHRHGIDEITMISATTQLLESMTNACQHAVPLTRIQTTLLAVYANDHWTVSAFVMNNVVEANPADFVGEDELIELDQHLEDLRGRGLAMMATVGPVVVVIMPACRQVETIVAIESA